MKPIVYIDGREGTTGLQIVQRLQSRADVELLLIDEDKRKDNVERKRLMNQADIVFLCLPDAAAREAVALIDNPRTRVIDASTAHRVAPGWVYGFPELSAQRRKEIRDAARVANPGCYATGFISVIYPLVRAGILPPDYPLAVHAVSGYTGAGKKAIAQYTDPNRDRELDTPRQYALTLSHKHIPEMMAVTGLMRKPVFDPIICDFPQGMVVSVPLHLDLLRGKPDLEALRAVYCGAYAGQKFIEVMPLQGEGVLNGGFLDAGALAGTNRLQIFVCGNEEQAMIAARLDNLGKGASGAAVQNMNLMLGLEETAGLLAE